MGHTESKGRTTMPADELPAGAIRQVRVDGEPVAVANVDGTVYAVTDTCTHASISLSGGDLCGRQIVCPWHAAMFDLKTGRATCGPAEDPLRTYQTRIENGKIVIEPREDDEQNHSRFGHFSDQA